MNMCIHKHIDIYIELVMYFDICSHASKLRPPLRSNGDTSCGLCSNVTKRSYALIASNLATLYIQRDIINRKIFLEDSHD